MNKILFPPNSFVQRCQEQIIIAKEKGALQPIATDYEIIEDKGIPFIIRIVKNLIRKEKAKKKEAKNPNFDPFLPYDVDLFVTDITSTHLCLLNKFNVIDEHLLIVTREFAEQTNRLNLEDFVAVWAVLAEVNGLVFYNCGEIAGASVKHKHLQLVPKQLAPDMANIPIETMIKSSNVDETNSQINPLSFKHSYQHLITPWEESITEAANLSLEMYQKLLTRLDLAPGEPYNLLMTREWMLIIPRSQPSYQKIGINSLGFAGAILVKNQQQLELVKTEKPLKILEAVAVKK